MEYRQHAAATTAAYTVDAVEEQEHEIIKYIYYEIFTLLIK